MIITILLIIILVFSAILHEYAHGWMAKWLGDDTAFEEGRLTLNPIKHLDPIGSILVPLVLILSKAPFFIAWAKPVPYNPYNLRDKKYGELKVAASGPMTNLILATVFGLIARFLFLPIDIKVQLADFFKPHSYISIDSVLALTSGSFIAGIFFVSLSACIVNLALALFNLIPIPPLDGFKILFTFLPTKGKMFFYQVEKYSFYILILLLMLGILDFIYYGVIWLFSLLTGL